MADRLYRTKEGHDAVNKLMVFASEIIEMASDGFDLDYMAVLSVAEKAGLIEWDEATEANREEWPEDVELGDPFWRQKPGALPANM